MIILRAGGKCLYVPGQQQGGTTGPRLLCRYSRSCLWNETPLLSFTLASGPSWGGKRPQDRPSETVIAGLVCRNPQTSRLEVVVNKLPHHVRSTWMQSAQLLPLKARRLRLVLTPETLGTPHVKSRHRTFVRDTVIPFIAVTGKDVKIFRCHETIEQEGNKRWIDPPPSPCIVGPSQHT